MLRPATPLTILLFAAFVLLLISVISVPIVKPIVLGEFDGVSYGVFGYCGKSGCSKMEVGYNPSVLPNVKGNFNLDPATRSTLSSILIVHPIAAFFTLIMFILAVVSHFHAPSHSPRYLLGVFILSILTLILALLSFLIDVLLFVPHMAWGSYIVLAATILIAASGIVSCAMRRTLVSRKARKRRIAENAEMNGENYYNRQAATGPLPPPITAPSIATTTPGNGDKLPSFATFESAQADADARAAQQADDDRVPLTSRTPTRSPETMPASLSGRPEDRYGPPPPMPGGRGGYGGGPPQRDQYGNIIPPQGGMRNVDPRNQFGPGVGGYRGRGGPPGGYRGRGGGPGYGRGGYGGPGGPGGYGPGPGGMRGGRGPPPNYPGGYNSRGGGYGGPGPRSVSPPSNNGYGYDQSRSQQSLNSSARDGFGASGRPDSLARAESPPPMDGMGMAGGVGQAIEMDATTGSRSPGLHPPGG
ncbi:hypothetical protein V490_05464, partial [Pseudogymnoascus sp. VKM F-3557]